MQNSRLFTVREYYNILAALRDSIEHHVGVEPATTLQFIFAREPWPACVVRKIWHESTGIWLSDGECLALGAVTDQEYLDYHEVMHLVADLNHKLA